MYTDDSTVYGPETSTDQLNLLMLNGWLNAVKDVSVNNIPTKKRGDNTVSKIGKGPSVIRRGVQLMTPEFIKEVLNALMWLLLCNP